MIVLLAILAMAATHVAAQSQCVTLGSVAESTCMTNTRYKDTTDKKIAQITKVQTEENSRLLKRLDQVETAINLLGGGTRNSSKVLASITQNIDLSRRVDEMEARIQQIEINAENFTELSNALVEAEMEINKLKNQTRDGYCQIRYNRKCFWLMTRLGPWITFDEATAVCASLGGKPANIYSEEHYIMMIEHLRSFIFTENGMYVWIGVRYDPETRTASLSDGSKAPFLKWGAGNPKRDHCCHISLTAVVDANNNNQNMQSAYPSFTNKGVLCEK